MFITRECDYAIRTVRALASGEKMTVKDICEAENIPQPYAYKILKKLENSEIVKSHRGVYGGYTLARGVNEITLYDIFIAVEETISLNECLQDGYECPNNCEQKDCKVHRLLRGIQEDLVGKLQNCPMDQVFAGGMV